MVLGGHHQPLFVWVMCVYLMGLKLSNLQIAAELDWGASDVPVMTEPLRSGLAARTPVAKLQAQVEIDDVYVVAGRKGQPAEVVKRGGRDDAAGFMARPDGAPEKRTSR